MIDNDDNNNDDDDDDDDDDRFGLWLLWQNIDSVQIPMSYYFSLKQGIIARVNYYVSAWERYKRS